MVSSPAYFHQLTEDPIRGEVHGGIDLEFWPVCRVAARADGLDRLRVLCDELGPSIPVIAEEVAETETP